MLFVILDTFWQNSVWHIDISSDIPGASTIKMFVDLYLNLNFRSVTCDLLISITTSPSIKQLKWGFNQEQPRTKGENRSLWKTRSRSRSAHTVNTSPYTGQRYRPFEVVFLVPWQIFSPVFKFFIHKDETHQSTLVNISVNVPVLVSWLIFNCSCLARCCLTTEMTV